MCAPCNSLPHDHPKLQEHRLKWKQRREMTNVPCHLFSNYDQVWRMKYRGRPTNLYKRATDSGQREDAVVRRPKQRRCANAIARMQKRSRGDDDDAEDGAPAAQRPRGGREKDPEEITKPAVYQDRVPHTTVTSIWANGEPGPLVMVILHGSIGEAAIEELNRKYAGAIVGHGLRP